MEGNLPHCTASLRFSPLKAGTQNRADSLLIGITFDGSRLQHQRAILLAPRNWGVLTVSLTLRFVGVTLASAVATG